MWAIIAYVSSGFTLAAFVTAIVAWVLKVKSEEKGRLIASAKTEIKAKLVQNTLEFFHVETKNLTEAHRFRIAMEQIRNRTNRFRTIAFLIGFLAIIAASLSAYAIDKLNKNPPPSPINPCDSPFDKRPLDCNFKNGR